MDYEVALSPCGHYVKTTLHADVTRDVAMGFVRDANLLADQIFDDGLRRFLVDARASRNMISNMGNFQFINHDVPHTTARRGALIALVVKPGDESHDFVETVTRNAGYLMRIYFDMDEAINWLAQA